MKAIVNGKILLPDREATGQALLFDQKIVGLSDTVPAGCEVIDAGGAYVAPGLVDVHIHGYLGADASDGDLAGLRTLARGILKNGVTSFLPTTMTVPWEELERAFAEAKSIKGKPTAILMKTVKGKGVSFMENQAGWHGKGPNDEECRIALEELQTTLRELEAKNDG